MLKLKRRFQIPRRKPTHILLDQAQLTLEMRKGGVHFKKRKGRKRR